MKKYIDGLKQGLGIMTIIILSIFGVYLVKAWSGTDGLTAGSGDLLTYDKWNQMLAKISDSLGGIIYDSPSNSYQFTGSILAGFSNVCDASRKGAFRTTSTAVQVCDGSSWSDLRSFALGTSSNPATSCYQIKQNYPTATDGLYYIKPATVTNQVWCDMTNGGRTLVVRTTPSVSYQVIDQVGTLTSPGQASTWKISDADIAAISKNTGYKFTCGTTTINFSASCSFGSTTPANGFCLTSPGTYSTSRLGLSSYDNGSAGAGKIIYAYNGYPSYGCLDPNGRSWTNSGTLRVK